MGKIISISGCRSIGKTTLINGLKKELPELITREGFRRADLGFDMSVEEDYYSNEKWYIQREIDEYDSVKSQNRDAVFLRGPEDLEFFAIHYPVTKGMEWDVEMNLRKELYELRKRRSDYVLYLTASTSNILERCRCDEEKKRENLQAWIDNWEDSFSQYIKAQKNVVVLNTDNLSASEVLEWTLNWFWRL